MVEKAGSVQANGAHAPAATKAVSRQYEIHDRANLFLLPVLCVLCIAGLAGFIDCYTVTLIFTVYIIFDLSWIMLYPESLPRYPHVIMVHHVITLALLSHPLRFPKDAHFTCLDGMVELSTFCLVARRQCRGWMSKLLNYLYWTGTIALRLGLQPYLLILFWNVTRSYDSVDRFIIMASQSFLCVFNVGLVALAVIARREHKRKLAAEKAATKAAELKAQ